MHQIDVISGRRRVFIRCAASCWVAECQSVRNAGGELALTSVNVICSLIGPRCKIGERSHVGEGYSTPLFVRLQVRVSRLGSHKAQTRKWQPFNSPEMVAGRKEK